jgi:hypothetical protein
MAALISTHRLTIRLNLEWVALPEPRPAFNAWVEDQRNIPSDFEYVSLEDQRKERRALSMRMRWLLLPEPRPEFIAD